MARTRAQNGTKILSSRQKETWKAKMTLRKTFEGDFKKMDQTWGMAEGNKRESFMEKEEWLHCPRWIKANKKSRRSKS